MGADGKVFGVLEEALAGRILAEPVGEAGHGVEPAQWTASVPMRWRAEVSRLMVPVAAPACLRIGAISWSVRKANESIPAPMMTYCVIPSAPACSRACSAYRARITTHIDVAAMRFVMTLSTHSNGRIRKTRRQNDPHSGGRTGPRRSARAGAGGGRGQPPRCPPSRICCSAGVPRQPERASGILPCFRDRDVVRHRPTREPRGPNPFA